MKKDQTPQLSESWSVFAHVFIEATWYSWVVSSNVLFKEYALPICFGICFTTVPGIITVLESIDIPWICQAYLTWNQLSYSSKDFQVFMDWQKTRSGSGCVHCTGIVYLGTLRFTVFIITLYVCTKNTTWTLYCTIYLHFCDHCSLHCSEPCISSMHLLTLHTLLPWSAYNIELHCLLNTLLLTSWSIQNSIESIYISLAVIIYVR